MAAAPAAEILGLLEMLMVTIVALMLFKWLVHSLVGWIPFIGNKAAAAADSVSTYVEHKIEAWLYPQLHTLLNWFEVLAHRTLDYPRAVWDALVDVDAALNHLVKTKVAQIVHAIIRPITDLWPSVLHRLTAAEHAIGRVPGEIETRLGSMAHAIEHTLTRQFENGIDRLRRDVLNPALHELHQGIDKLRGDVARDVHTIEHEIGAVGADLRALARRLDIPVGLIEAMIAALGIAGAATALETLGRCEPKLRKMCTSDPNQWAKLIEGLALLALWPGLIELTKMAQGLINQSGDIIRDVIVNGSGG